MSFPRTLEVFVWLECVGSLWDSCEEGRFDRLSCDALTLQSRLAMRLDAVDLAAEWQVV